MGSIMPRIADRFRGFLPVVVDVETGGFDAQKDALLEVAACIIQMDDFGRLFVAETIDVNVEPFEGAREPAHGEVVVARENDRAAAVGRADEPSLTPVGAGANRPVCLQARRVIRTDADNCRVSEISCTL